jgi:TonB-linked SusC/RagA family outer membrane protein
VSMKNHRSVSTFGFEVPRVRWLGSGALVGVLFALAAFLVPTSAFGQLTITGQVVGEDQSPIVGAEVYVQAARTAAVTDQEGRYRLVVPEARLNGQSATLAVRRLGYRSRATEVPLTSGEVTENFVLSVDPLELEAIVAIGQGALQERRAIGATINSVSGEDVTVTGAETNVVAALAGKAPNVEVTSTSGDPGSGAYIRIRGANSYLGGTQPLFVVDGVPINNESLSLDLNIWGVAEPNRASDINPEDVESIEILKGAAAATIYGSRAKNGVVLITTKRGRQGTSQAMYKVAATWDKAYNNHNLQRRFGRGVVNPADPTVNIAPTATHSWGPELAPGTPTFDHAEEFLQTGHTYDQTLQFSGGSDRTTYFLSLGRLDQEGAIVGNSEYSKTTVRLKGTHDFADNFTIGGNAAFATSDGAFIEKGSAVSGIQLGSLRTPPEFNNLPYIDEDTGLHRSYLCNPNACLQGPFNSVTTSRTFDNPFWVANELDHSSELGRVFGGIDASYQPLDWLSLDYRVGTDYYADERLSLWPKSSSENPFGQMQRADFVRFIFDTSFLATVTRELTDDIGGSLSLGHNFNHSEARNFFVQGFNQLLGTDQLDFSVDREPDEFRSEIRTDGIFGLVNLELFDQLFFNATVRGDKASTFGEEKRFWYPGASVAWEFTASPLFEGDDGWLDFGKLRFAYGRAGQHPPVFSNINAFETDFFDDGWLNVGLNSIYQGREGVLSEGTLGNAAIEPERSEEYEFGGNIAFLDNRVAIDYVHYRKYTEDAIVGRNLPPSTGFFSIFDNALEWENIGHELQVDVRPVQRSNFAWEISGQWARNESCVTDLAGSEAEFIDGFASGSIYIVEPDDPDDPEGTCHPFGVIYSGDMVRFGRGLSVGGVDIDTAFPNAPDGAIYIAENGLPLVDPQRRVIGDPNPEWTGSVRNTLTLFDRLRVSALVDVKQGGDMWNGTRGALFTYGTHQLTERCHGAGCSLDNFGQALSEIYNRPDEKIDGPGANTPVTLGAPWFRSNGGGFGLITQLFVEEASFVKLREMALAFTIGQDWFPGLSTVGFSSIDVKLAGRNLKTWTDYTGIDPESNLTDQSTGRGLDYFNNPQVRSYVIALQFNR